MNSITLDETETIESLQHKIGSMLDLHEPVSEKVVRAILGNNRYAYHLVQCKDTPIFLNYLLEHPTIIPEEALPSKNKISNGRLLAKAAKAFLRWGLSGFKRVDDTTFERRMTACFRCPYLIAPPNGAMYKLATVGMGEENRICQLCGCIAARKARLPTETCPDFTLEKPLVNRWGELLEESES